MGAPGTRPSAPDLEVAIVGHVGWIRLNRLARKNAFTIPMLHTWAEAYRLFQRDDEIRVVVLTGRGDAFCAGADLDVLDVLGDREPLADRRLMTDDVHQVALAAEQLTKPLIAGVNGVAVGAGLDMALMCDYRIAVDEARMSEGYVRVGLVPGDGGCYYLPRIVGRSRALRLLWTGEFVGAEQGLRWGLVDEVCPRNRLEDRLTTFAAELAAQPPVAVQLIKSAVRHGEHHDLRSSLDLIASHQAVARSTRDSAEAMAAFRDGRPPVFTGT
ncbi:enoyl-CoA hydratase (plasmid) [Pseudonocardia sp. EC080610-09]|uniref:enoyl-CoA hydratase/isomerase family protein n=1 Tax=unclassified Pseudonocardia TaxID=2619320 RepID=UPI0007062A74|nr:MULTISPECIES: enoyl-CoA hydratase-related protein [unclassified Pseudonocardia]ALL79528.1 enoyl-CoA hydratase [Pseudonocardia sp. EC080610-09]ALL85520.1 enoyl-CoA hydratase [Pseudonocardia sp. EC080619-01]